MSFFYLFILILQRTSYFRRNILCTHVPTCRVVRVRSHPVGVWYKTPRVGRRGVCVVGDWRSLGGSEKREVHEPFCDPFPEVPLVVLTFGCVSINLNGLQWSNSFRKETISHSPFDPGLTLLSLTDPSNKNGCRIRSRHFDSPLVPHPDPTVSSICLVLTVVPS